jgi:uncharacterized protein YfaS (alpha-2-macroglobulin family)
MKKLGAVIKSMFPIVLVISSCTSGSASLPAPGESSLASGVQLAVQSGTPAAATPEPTATLVQVPPVVLRTTPGAGQEQPLDAPIEITFDEPMDRTSVEQAFTIQPTPGMAGTFTWVNDQTVQFIPKGGFERGQNYLVQIGMTAKSQAGVALQRPFQLRFSTVGFLEVANVQPSDRATEVPTNAVVTVLFNRPVVPLNAIESAASLPDPLTFEPPVMGKGQWLNTSILQFTPGENGFLPATRYTARIAKGLTALDNSTLEKDYVWTFTTVVPAVVGSIPASGDIYVSPTPAISLTFNQQMDRTSVEANFSLVNEETGKSVPGQFAWTEAGLTLPGSSQEAQDFYSQANQESSGPTTVGVETVAFRPATTLEFSATYRIELPKGTRGKIDQAATQSVFTATFAVTPYPKIVKTSPANGETDTPPGQGLQVTFSGPMNPDSVVIGKNLVITPAISVTQVYTYWSDSNTQLEIHFPDKASTAYKATFGADIEGRYGQKLGASQMIAWTTGALPPLVYLHSPGRIATYDAYTTTVAYITARNVSRVDFKLYRLPKDDFISLNGTAWYDVWDKYQPVTDNLISAWQLETQPALNDDALYRVELGQESGLGSTLPVGLYYLEVSNSAAAVYPQARQANYEPTPDRQMLVVSKHNLTFKTSSTDSLVWLTDLRNSQVVPDIPVTFIATNDKNQPEPLGQSVTAQDGTALIDYAPRPNAYEARFAFAGNPDKPGEDFAVAVSNWTQGIDPYLFSNVSVEYSQQLYSGYFYTDRGIYRPGQTVYFKGIIRTDHDARYSLPVLTQPVTVTITDSQGKDIFSDKLTLDEVGTLNGSFDLSEGAALGPYSLQAVYEGENYFYGNFLVEAYRAPEFQVETMTDKAQYAQGETIQVTATAQFFSGGPVSNAKVHWTLLSEDYTFNYTGLGFYDFTEYDYTQINSPSYVSGFGEKIAEGDGVTDKDGRFTFEVTADIANKTASQKFTFDVTVTDINNQEVANQADAIVNKGLFYVGLHPEQYVGQVGKEGQVDVIVVDWESQPVAKQEVQLVFAEHKFYSVKKQSPDGSYYWENTAENIPVYTTTVTSGQDGKDVAGFTPETPGVFEVLSTATDRLGNEVRSSTFMWVSGEQYVNWGQENDDRIQLVADKREYSVGDTAIVLVPQPYSGTVRALVTLERGQVYDHYVTELKTNSSQLRIPITEEMIPNIYVSVVVLQGGAEGGIPGFKLGYADLQVNVAQKLLHIAITPNKPSGQTYEPGDTAQFKIQVTDVQGQPVKAEVSLALVDKAVLSLAPIPPDQLRNAFWQSRGLGVGTASGLTLAIDRVNLALVPGTKGGGGGGPLGQGFGEIRRNFKDTALWVPDLMTNAQGESSVETVLPDNLTTWTLIAEGVTGANTLVGESRADIVSTKPLLVRPVVPRFFVVGDQARLGMIVQNNSKGSLEVETRFEAQGLTIKPVDVPTLTVKAGERTEVEYDVTVGDVITAQLTMGAKSIGQSPGYADAVALELPVYRFNTPETVATAGELAEDGTRTEGIVLPGQIDLSHGNLTVSIDPSLAAGMRNGLTYLENFPYECTEQTVSRFLANVVTYRAYQQLKLSNPTLAEKLPGLVSVGLQRLYSEQHFDGGWGWWVADSSDPSLSAYVLLGMIEARKAGFTVDQTAIENAVHYLEAGLLAPKDVTDPQKGNQQAFVLYVLAEAGAGDMGRNVTLFDKRQQLDSFGQAFLALAMVTLDKETKQVQTLLTDISNAAVTDATGAHWQEAQVDYYAMDTDTRSTAIIIAALSRIQPDNPLLPSAVRWLMSIRENGGHWTTTQENAWAIIGLTEWMVTTGELKGDYAWQVYLNGKELGQGKVDSQNIDETSELQVAVKDLLSDEINRLVIERGPISPATTSTGRLYYDAYLTYYKQAQQIEALDSGIIVSRQYQVQGATDGKPISSAKVDDVIQVKLTLIAANDLHYVVVEDPFPAGTEGINTSLATTSVVGQPPKLIRTDQRNPWSGGYGWWFFSHSELQDDKAVLFATYLPKGTYEYTYSIRAYLPGEYRVIPTHAQEMYFPDVFGRSAGGTFKITE